MTTYLLPCECSADVAVTAGQAGGRVACRQCGRELLVPKLGDLSRLRRKDAVARPSVMVWRPAQAVAFLGAITCAGALAAALWIAPRVTGVVNEPALRAAVLAVDDLTVYRVWSEGLSRERVRRPPADEELALLRQTQFADGLRGMLHIVAACGALAAFAAGLRLFLDSPQAGGGVQPGTSMPRAGGDRP